VGSEAGPVTLPLCSRLLLQFPEVSVITGGGVRSVADLRQLAGSGISGALVASAIHDGTFLPDDFGEFSAN
ncbi:MAG: nickel transporter, partial [Fuerstiella sp.]|nr:nickel transporter [Fuerstiella sp.]